MTDAPKSFTRFFPMIARVLLGLLFAFSGVNGLFNLIPPPKDGLPPAAMTLMAAMMQSGYMLKLVFITQLLGGLMLLVGRFVPLGLALLAPVIVNIVCFHLFLEPKGIPVAIVVLLIELYLAWAYRGVFRPMLAAGAKPGA
jgi:uncharacterized membrane protein YphA (DoxX/SURF4 family)